MRRKSISSALVPVRRRALMERRAGVSPYRRSTSTAACAGSPEISTVLWLTACGFGSRLRTSRFSTTSTSLKHRDNCDSILRSDPRRGPAYCVIQFDRDNVRFFRLENCANKLLDDFSVGDDADFAGRHRALVDCRPLLEEEQCGGAALRGARASAHPGGGLQAGRTWRARTPANKAVKTPANQVRRDSGSEGSTRGS